MKYSYKSLVISRTPCFLLCSPAMQIRLLKWGAEAAGKEWAARICVGARCREVGQASRG